MGGFSVSLQVLTKALHLIQILSCISTTCTGQVLLLTHDQSVCVCHLHLLQSQRTGVRAWPQGACVTQCRGCRCAACPGQGPAPAGRERTRQIWEGWAVSISQVFIHMMNTGLLQAASEQRAWHGPVLPQPCLGFLQLSVCTPSYLSQSKVCYLGHQLPTPT
jgi:hypothetical protein